MAKRQKLTNNTDESSVGLMFAGDSVFSIPYFQRPYKWKPERLQQLENDILQLIDGATDTHFLGAIIFHGRPTNPSDPDIYEVIDGQQRLTTIFLYLCAVVKTLCRYGQHDEASGLFLKYIVINRHTTLLSNSRLQSSKDDRKQLNKVIEDIIGDKDFSSKLQSFKFKALPAVGSDSGRVWNNYRAALRFLANQTSLETIQRLRDIYTALLEQISVVQIDVLDPVNGPKIFDSLNSRQEPMTTGDLVRNEIFSRVANSHPDEVEGLDQELWQPFYAKFKQGDRTLFDDYFFPFGLIKNPNLRKSGIYAHLRQEWKEEKDPAIIISDLSRYQDAFLDLELGSNRQGHAKEVAAALARISNITPSSTYPFLMQLSQGLKDQHVTREDALGVLAIVESFLVRRAICGHEPTGLHAVFKRLWEDCDGSPVSSNVEENIRKHKTVTWPSNKEVSNCARERPLYGSSIASFILREWNKSFGGDQPDATLWIEHVLPDTLSEDWKVDFSDEMHKASKDLLANLLPLSQPMNQALGNKGYSIKRPVYLEDSMFKGTRDFAKEFLTWSPADFSLRASKLSGWVVERWPF